MKVGPARYCRGGDVEFARYGNGNIAIRILDARGRAEAVASVNMDETNPRPLGPTEVWLKGWSENEGVPESLVAAGVVILTGVSTQAGWAEAVLAELTPAAVAELERQQAAR